MKKSMRPQTKIPGAKNAGQLLNKLVGIMNRLRGPKGCQWDKQQTHKSLVKYLFSEAKEVRDAIKRRDIKNLEEELGDVLLQVVFHSQLASEKGLFDITGVIDSINKKLVRRHPHVFSKTENLSPSQVHKQWKLIKLNEKRSKK
jgi:MazG family protein